MLKTLEEKIFRRAVYIILTMAAFYDGGRLYAALYYVLIGWFLLWFIIFCLRELKSKKGKELVKSGLGGRLRVGGLALKRQAQSASNFMASYSGFGADTDSNAVYQQGFFKLLLLTALVTHIYIFAIAFLDKFFPDVALVWYGITQPLVDFQTQLSFGYGRMGNLLIDYGYVYRLAYITHTYVMPIYLSIICIVFVAPELPRMFKLEVVAHLSALKVKYGNETILSDDLGFIVRVLLPQLVFIPAIFGALIYVFVAGAVPLSLSGRSGMRILLFAPHVHRAEMFPFAAIFSTFPFIIMLAVKLVFVNLQVTANIIRRKFRQTD